MAEEEKAPEEAPATETLDTKLAALTTKVNELETKVAALKAE